MVFEFLGLVALRRLATDEAMVSTRDVTRWDGKAFVRRERRCGDDPGIKLMAVKLGVTQRESVQAKSKSEQHLQEAASWSEWSSEIFRLTEDEK